ncbi:MAG: transglutaminase-like domain-containing protein [Bacteroidota bacterium]
MKVAVKVTVFFIFHLVFASAGMAQASERWYILSLGNRPVGYFMESVSGGSPVKTQIEMKMKISRLGNETSIESKQGITEDVEGNLVAISSELLFSKQLNIANALFSQGMVKITGSAGGKETTNTIPYTGKLVGTEWLRRQTIERLKKPGDSIAYKTFLADFAVTAEGVRKLEGDEFVEIDGKAIRAMRVKETFRGLPVVRVSWLDENAHLIKSSEPNPFGQMTMVLTDRKSALAVADSKIELSEDQYSATVAVSNVRLPQARMIESMAIRVRHRRPELGFPDVSGTYQEVSKVNKDYYILNISQPKIGAVKEKLPASIQNHFIESTSFLDTEDTLVVKTMRQIVGVEKDPWSKALLIRNWVNKNMKFNPGIAMAPSSEVIRNMEGTCVSFATITTTLCRAAGIPSRYLMGFVYVDGMWGGHAWTEVYVDSSWIPIDAAMVSPYGIADAARFYFTRSSVRNGLGECFVGGSQLYANVDIDILGYTLNSKAVTPSGQPCEVTKNGYSNPGLGITMKSIKGFEFSELNKVYPDNILFSMDNTATGSSIKLYQEFISPRADFKKLVAAYLTQNKMDAVVKETEFAGKKALKATAGSSTILAILNGMDVFVFFCSGKGSEQQLSNALTGFRFTGYDSVEFQNP